MHLNGKLLGLIGGLLFYAGSVQAVPIQLNAGVGVETNSWQIGLNLTTSGTPFDTIEAFIQNDTGAGPFESPGFDNYNVAGWSGSLINPGYVLSSGPAADPVGFIMHFAGDIMQTVAVDFFVYSAGSLLGSIQGNFSNGSFVSPGAVSDPTGEDYNRTAVPEPSILALLGIGLAGLGFARRRKAA